jgi:hypothetical protein
MLVVIYFVGTKESKKGDENAMGNTTLESRITLSVKIKDTDVH